MFVKMSFFGPKSYNFLQKWLFRIYIGNKNYEPHKSMGRKKSLALWPCLFYTVKANNVIFGTESKRKHKPHHNNNR
jgi:hypothetical protein